jgi:prepilin-type N-terminal cleavage/methylation domain-containing protein
LSRGDVANKKFNVWISLEKRKHLPKGFTLVEVIVVVIILSLLVSLGGIIYRKTYEKGRSLEAKVILGQIRDAEEAYKLANLTYNYTMDFTALGISDLPQTSCSSSHYFRYTITTSADGSTFLATATRCTGTTGTGKRPDASSGYTLSIDQSGTLSVSPPDAL